MHKISTPDEPAAAQIVFDDFAQVDIRAGVIVSAEGRGSEARVQVNFGAHGMKWLALEYAKLTPC